MKADSTVKRELRRLRRFIDENNGSTDPVVLMRVKMAYEVECAIRWAREDGIKGWPTPLNMAVEGGNLLANTLKMR